MSAREQRGLHLASAVNPPSVVPDGDVEAKVLVRREVGGCGSVVVVGESQTGLSRQTSLHGGRLVGMSTTIRVSEKTRSRFAGLAKATGKPMTQLLDEAADALERRIFFDHFAARYAELRHDANKWKEIEAERAQENSSLSDRSA